MATTQMQAQGPMGTLMLTSLGGFVVTLGVALAMLMSGGHASFNTSSDGVNWGLPVVAYVFLSMTSTGLALVAALATTFGQKEYYAITKRCTWLSIATLVGGFTSLALEMGHPFRMLWAIPMNMQIVSPLFWMGVFYLIALVLLVLKFQKMNAGDWDSPGSRMIGNLSVVAEILALGMLGAAFGMMAMRPAWYGSTVPLSFLLGGVTAGAAFAVLATHLAHGTDQDGMPEKVRSLLQGGLAKLFTGATALYLAYIGFHTLSGLWTNADGLQVMDRIVATPWFWVGIIGLVVALFIMLSPAQRSNGAMQSVASLLVLVAVFAGRYDYIIGGQLVPMFKGTWVQGLVDYAPSLTEWMVTGVGIFLTLALFALGERALNLGASPKK
ncbi:MAG TPA: NrfD/PsrC family molybdoenzyme membrane anchor subunit [Burkholderiales bacterium]|nr:NrfD/PsrC family molybdoenzyme membrane anchor subunit [Burkholderiales bacterium]